MIILPDVKQKPQNHSHLKFIPGLKFTEEGLGLVDVPDFEFDKSIRSVNHSAHIQGLGLMFESSPVYFVIGEADRSIFRIIFRKEKFSSEDNSFPILPSKVRRNVNIRKMAKEDRERKKESKGNEAANNKYKQVIVCMPEVIRKVCICNDQIFFRSDKSIFIYTPASTSKLEVSSNDIYMNHFLYILSGNSILVYGESLIEEIEIELMKPGKKAISKQDSLESPSQGESKELGISKIIVLDNAMFLIRNSIIYKIVNNQCVFAYDCGHSIAYACANSNRVYLHNQDHLYSISVFDEKVMSVYVGMETASLHLTDDFLLLQNGKNGTLFLTLDTLVCVHSELVDTDYSIISCYGKTISYLARDHIVVHVAQRLANKSIRTPESLNEPILYCVSDIFKDVIGIEGGKEEEEEDFNQKLQDMLDNKTEDTKEEKTEIWDKEKEDELLRLMGDEGDESSSSELSFYYEGVSGELDDDLQSEKDLNNGTVGQRESQLVITKLQALEITGLTNPTTHNVYASIVADNNVTKVYFKDRKFLYKQSGFFIPNHIEWFKKEFEKYKVEEELPVSQSVYEFVESKIKIKNVKTVKEGGGAVQLTRDSGINKKRKTGGF
ncbi:hypothetical protein PAEPH01_0327 [Pancytospora epiphaga]|nr:hypothetical protein PAEPH01_0327 [Pancytospora epiphaga]